MDPFGSALRCSCKLAEARICTVKSRSTSLRFTEAEGSEISSYIQLTGEQEAVVLERVAMRGLREERIERALMAYVGGASSSEAAAIAGIGRHALLTRALDRGINLLDDQPEDLFRDLGQAAELLGDERLARAVSKARDSSPVD